MKISEKDMKDWRTGLHAANPEQAKDLVDMLDKARRQLERLFGALDDADPVCECGPSGVMVLLETTRDTLSQVTPRGFVVLGENVSLLWPVLAFASMLLVGLATVQEEREAGRAMKQCRSDLVDAANLAEHALDAQAQCAGVLMSCVEVVAQSQACTCWIDSGSAE